MSVTINTLVLSDRGGDESKHTWAMSDHSSAEPRVVIQKRKVPASADENAVVQTTRKVVYGVKNASGDLLTSKASVEVIYRYPQGAAIATIQQMVDRDQLLHAATEADSQVEKQSFYNA